MYWGDIVWIGIVIAALSILIYAEIDEYRYMKRHKAWLKRTEEEYRQQQVRETNERLRDKGND